MSDTRVQPSNPAAEEKGQRQGSRNNSNADAQPEQPSEQSCDSVAEKAGQGEGDENSGNNEQRGGLRRDGEEVDANKQEVEVETANPVDKNKWTVFLSHGMLSSVEKLRMSVLAKTLNDLISDDECWPSKLVRWEHRYDLATETILVGGASFSVEEVYVGAPSYDLSKKLGFHSGAVVFLSDDSEVGIYAGLLRGKDGTKMKTKLIFGIRRDDGVFELVIRDKRAYPNKAAQRLWYVPKSGKPSSQPTPSKAEWKTGWEGFVASRQESSWKLQAAQVGYGRSKMNGKRTSQRLRKKAVERQSDLAPDPIHPPPKRPKRSGRDRKAEPHPKKERQKHSCTWLNCKETFTSKRSLSKHETVHRVHGCKKCKKVYKSAFALKRHVSAVHLKSVIPKASLPKVNLNPSTRIPASPESATQHGSTHVAQLQRPSTHAAQEQIMRLEGMLARSEDRKEIALRDMQVSFLTNQLKEQARRSEEVTLSQAMNQVLPFVDRVSGSFVRPIPAPIQNERQPMHKWSPQQVGDFMETQYVSSNSSSAFVEERVCGRELVRMTVSDLMESPFGLRKRKAEAILDAIADAKRGCL